MTPKFIEEDMVKKLTRTRCPETAQLIADSQALSNLYMAKTRFLQELAAVESGKVDVTIAGTYQKEHLDPGEVETIEDVLKGYLLRQIAEIDQSIASVNDGTVDEE